MKIKEVNSFDELQEHLISKKKYCLLLYKSGTEKSDCAYENLMKSAEKSEEEMQVLAADVAKVRDIHGKYDIQTAPSLLYFEGETFKHSVKGCQSTQFYRSFFSNSLYSAQGETKNKQKRVVVYSTPTCPHCNSLKDYLKRNQIAFRDIDVSKDQKMAQELVRKSGQQGVPQTEINGKIVVGFNRPKINELLGINA
jgi:glutaredoxin-like YruB-family protein